MVGGNFVDLEMRGGEFEGDGDRRSWGSIGDGCMREGCGIHRGGGLGLQLFLKLTYFESPHSLLYLQRYS